MLDRLRSAQRQFCEGNTDAFQRGRSLRSPVGCATFARLQPFITLNASRSCGPPARERAPSGSVRSTSAASTRARQFGGHAANGRMGAGLTDALLKPEDAET